MRREWTRDDLLRDMTAAAWINDRLAPPYEGTVAELVPSGYDRYLRVLHPVERTIDDQPIEQFSWSDVARVNGRIAHAEMQWTNISTGGADELVVPCNSGPSYIDFAPGTMIDEIARLLTGDRTDVSCTFAFWEGNTAHEDIARDFPKARIGAFNFYLTSGPSSRAAESLHGLRANMWWPEDRSWYVCSHFDFICTYIGASSAAADRILLSSAVEAWPAAPNHRITADGDKLNPARPIRGRG
ncbi:hypothetical protein [Gordonia neofelifaecis]|uniref:Uncharacterized protein n=1 Tax=Gordonia neofelifaecis NRRL B-59395 TaxID=644548 RepID=F1YLD3_9ACTN|nr:hypothetical protein [Gordonia neofelifaecis]EGD54593.1 hypothetical protein SCNU_13463 [Gordonia neofelifaecis NRRL B-59395]